MKRTISSLALIAIMAVIFAALHSWLNEGILHHLTQPALSSTQRIEILRAYFLRLGWMAPATYLIFVVVEVIIAPIPGLMLYAPGGMIFGPFFGGLLALTGNILGAGVASIIGKKLASGLKHTAFCKVNQGESLRRLSDLINQRGGWVIFWLRLNPLTSTDLLSYAAGASGIPTSHTMLATGAGMAPLCFLQAWLSDSLFNQFPDLIYPFLFIGVAYVLVVVVILKRWMSERPEPATADS